MDFHHAGNCVVITDLLIFGVPSVTCDTWSPCGAKDGTWCQAGEEGEEDYAEHGRADPGREKGSSLNSAFLTPTPPASSLYVHVPVAPPPLDSSGDRQGREKGSSLNSAFLTPTPPAPSLHVHVLVAPPPLDSSGDRQFGDTILNFSELGMVSLRQVSFGKEEETRTLKPFAETLRVQSRLAKLDQQPEASLAWWWGDPSCEA